LYGRSLADYTWANPVQESRELVRNQRLVHWVSEHLLQSLSKQISSKLMLPRMHC
jgi:hypothetical protein